MLFFRLFRVSKSASFPVLLPLYQTINPNQRETRREHDNAGRQLTSFVSNEHSHPLNVHSYVYYKHVDCARIFKEANSLIP